MKTLILFGFYSITSFVFCQTHTTNTKVDFTIAFGSCNKQTAPQPLWKEILKNKPNIFIWGGDNIYADSDDMNKVANDYKIQNSNPEYQKLKSAIPIMATWDDHDYGKNDVGSMGKEKRKSTIVFGFPGSRKK
ncbi:hypothetical protein AB832_00650 [Flavobacteriaceae bacterium (ex Bugula neritina AB1)]|nr:hypothetical protein AB832_00650 [Flavobacteriaceae bacterium (ex Bugula neritina AB1)]